MPHGFTGASRQLCRRRRWVSMLPEQSTRELARHPRREADELPEKIPMGEPLPSKSVSSVLPRRTWVLALIVISGLLTWAAIVGIGVWLDVEQLDPWRGILGIQAGRVLQFYTTLALLTCAQLSYLIFWRRSSSRKDFSGRYRVWFWGGAVCSVFCVASATRFHELWASHLTEGMSLIWTEVATVAWLVPATTMLLTAMHLIRRDMPAQSASTSWTQVSRVLAMTTGFSLLFGSLAWPEAWVNSINAALGALWPTVFAATLLIHARYVTYVTNEAAQEIRQPERTSRWNSRLKAFARHIGFQAREEWQLYRQQRATAKAAALSSAGLGTPSAVEASESRQAVSSKASEPSPRERRTARPSPSAQATAPLKQLSQQRTSIEEVEAPTRMNSPSAAIQPSRVHPPQPIPAPHFPIDQAPSDNDTLTQESESNDQSPAIPEGYAPEQWRGLSKKDRKRLRQMESAR